MAPVLVDVPFPNGTTFKGVVRQFIGVGTLNVKTARGEVKAESTDIIVTLEDDPDDPENQDNLDDIRDGKTTMVFPEELFYALWPSAGVVQKMKDSDRVVFDSLGNAVFVGQDGMVTEEDGTEVTDTPENRVRFPGAFYTPQVVNGPRAPRWPFPPRINPLSTRPTPKDQGALNKMLVDKVFPETDEAKAAREEQGRIDKERDEEARRPKVDNTLPGDLKPRPDQSLPTPPMRPDGNPNSERDSDLFT